MKCSSGKHTWHDQLCADRCCNPKWERILILPNERIRQVLNDDPNISADGINYAGDGFKFAWRKIGGTAGN